MEPNLSEQLVKLTNRLNLLSKAHDDNAELLANLTMQVQMQELVTSRMLKDQADGKLVRTADGNPDKKYYLELLLSFFQGKESPQTQEPVQTTETQTKEYDFTFGGDYGRKV